MWAANKIGCLFLANCDKRGDFTSHFQTPARMIYHTITKFTDLDSQRGILSTIGHLILSAIPCFELKRRQRLNLPPA